MATMSTYYRGTRSPHTKRARPLWLAVAVALAAVLAAAVFVSVALSDTAEARMPGPHPPKVVLMKGAKELQKGRYISYSWTNKDGLTVHADGVYSFRPAVSVRAGSRLHIRINKPQQPDKFRIVAYKGLNKQGWPIRKGRLFLDKTFRPVERDGKTVAWDVYFRVKRPDRHYYLETYEKWNEPAEGTYTSYGDALRTFHVKTR
jgi:hypothetical protein